MPEGSENCTKIVFTQVICPKAEYQDGTSAYFKNQSDSQPKWEFQDKDQVNGGKKCVVDYLPGENDPYYNGDDAADAHTQGNSEGKVNASMADFPRTSNREFENLEKKHGKNVSKLIYEFEVCAFCAQGPDAGAYYGCRNWVFEQARNAATGSSSAGATSATPSKKFGEAVDEWSKNHAFAIPRK